MKLDIERPQDATEIARELGWIGPDEHIERLSVAGEGNMNRTLRAHLQNRTLILKQSLPYVAKYPDIPAPVARLDTEADFYRLTAEVPALVGRMPGLIGYHAQEHLLCLEDLGAGADRSDLYAMPAGAAGDADLPALIDWLGTLHTAVPVTAQALPNHDMRALNHAHIFDIPLDAAAGVTVPEPLRELQTAFCADPELAARARSLGAIYLGSRGHTSAPALLHGDFYPGSWLRSATGGVRVIDFEFAFTGPAEFDHGVLRAHLTFAGIGAAQSDDLLVNAARPAGYSQTLTEAFAGMEIIRRILGVAQLSLGADEQIQAAWLRDARQAVLSWEPDA